MRSKHSCEKVFFDIKQQHFEKKYASIGILKSILDTSEGIEQINLLKKVEHYLLQDDIKENELVLVIHILCAMYYQAPVKSAHKKTLTKIIQEASKKYPIVVEQCLYDSLNKVMVLCTQNMTNEEIEKTMLHILCLIDNLKLGKTVADEKSDEIWIFVSLILKTVIQQLNQESSSQKKNDWSSLCQNILKLVSHIIQNCGRLKDYLKNSNDEKFEAASKDITVCLKLLLTSDETKLNCRLNAAFAYCNYIQISFGVKSLNGILDESLKFSLSSRLCLYSSIMAVLPAEEFIKHTDSTISDKILYNILEIAKISDSSEVLLQCARGILQWTNVILNILNKDTTTNKILVRKIFIMFSDDEKYMKRLFEYVLDIRDHFIDSLRHLSKDIFQNILNLHILSSRTEPRKSVLLKEMTVYLLKDLPAHNRGKYGMLRHIVEKIGTETILEWDSSLPSELYKVLEEQSLVSHVSELYQVLFNSSLNTVDDENFQKVWLVPLLEVLCQGSKEQTTAISEHILPKLLDVKPSALTFLLSQLSDMWEKNIGNSFSALVICLKLYQKQKGALSYLEFISSDSLIKAFFHADDQVRISGFALLCENYKTTEPIDLNTFELIKCGLPFSINCQSPPFRQQLISYMKKLFTRIAESGYAMLRKNQTCKIQDSKDLQKMLLPNIYQEFLQWLKNYLFSCLNPGANFPRRVTSLNLLFILHEIFSGSISIVDSEVSLKTLIYTLQDTYDHNKHLALQLLTSKLSLRLDKENENLFNSALILASSTKPPDTITAAYLFAYIVQSPECFQHIVMRKLSLLSQVSTLSLKIPDLPYSDSKFHFCIIALLMYELNKQFQLAKNNLLEAAACSPLYGILTCIRSVLNTIKIFCEETCLQWQHLIRELITMSLNVAYVVEPIVCNSSPEGHLPMDTDSESIAQLQAAVRKALGNRFQSAVVVEEFSHGPDSVELDIVKTHAVTAQLLLLCCWRTHREISLLFGDLTEKLPLFNPDIGSTAGILSADQMKDIGSYFLHQMSLVKHRGAFEQAHIGLSKMCCRLWRCDIKELNVLPKVWIEDMILAIKGFKEEIQLCPTRRSAGLPFIIQAIVASEPLVSNSSFFKKTVSTFLNLAKPSQEYNSDVQVHALNILRTLFRDASLGEIVMPFVSEGLKISILGFKSSYWAVRNSSTLLYSALMTRLFGVNRSHDETGKKNRLSGKKFYSYYKNLYTFLIDELKQCAKSIENKETEFFMEPSLYPILLLLVRLYPAPGENDTLLSAFIPYLKICVSSPIWKTRKLAAKALVAFTPHEKILVNLCTLIKELNSAIPLIQNEVHGKLLQILYYMEDISSLPDFEKKSLKSVFESLSCFDFYIMTNECLSTKALFLQIYLYAMTLDVEPDSSHLVEMLYEEFQHPCIGPDKDNYIAVGIAILFLKELELHNSKQTSEIQTSLKFFNYFKGSRQFILNFTVIEILLWLLQEDSTDMKHYLETSDDIVVVNKVLKTVLLLDKKKYDIRDFTEECLQYTLEILGDVTNPSLLRQIYKLLSFIPFSLSSQWKFLETSHSFDLIDKLEYVLYLMETHSRDDVTCELLVYSAHLIAKLSEEYESVDKETFFFTQRDVKVIKDWLEIIEESAFPDNSILLRNTIITVLKVLVKKSFFPKSSLIGLLNLWQPLLLLLIDDEPDIKYRASEVVMKMKFPQNEGNSVSSVVPTKAVDLMMEIFIENNYEDPEHCVSMLINWMLSSDMVSYETVTDEQPFDKGELNVFSEDLNLTDIVRNHLSAYLSSFNSSKNNQILAESIFCCNDKKSLTFADIIILCLSEISTATKNILTREAISPILDAYFDRDLIQISQRLDVANVLLPFSIIHSDFRTLADELLQQFQNLEFRTFFIEDLISKVQCFLNQVQLLCDC